VPIFGSTVDVAVEKAVVANCSAVREWDSNGTNFGFNPELGHIAGEFGHNDFYSVATAAAQLRGRDGAYALKGMILLDEIRGRLAEVFSLKSYKIDHVVHGAVASAATFAAMMGGHGRADRKRHRHGHRPLHPLPAPSALASSSPTARARRRRSAPRPRCSA
jgi:2-methylcitrate dehydratase